MTFRSSFEHLVVTYHYIRPTNSDGVTGITPETFVSQLRAIREQFTVVGVDEFLRRRDLETGLALITFDDSLRDQYEYAQPILREMRIPAVFYAPMRPYSEEEDRWCPQHLLHALAQELGWEEFERRAMKYVGDVEIDSPAMNRLYHYESPNKRPLKYIFAFSLTPKKSADILRKINAGVGLKAEDWYMTTDHLRDLQNLGHALGGHGFDHSAYSTLTPEQQAVDLHRASSTMNRLFGARPRTMAYPFGRSAAGTAALARSCGYTHCFGTDERVDAKFVMERLGAVHASH